MGFFSDLIDKLNKNKITSLKGNTIISTQRNYNKRESKKIKFIAALGKTTKLNQLDLRAYDKDFNPLHIFSLPEIITAIAVSKSIQFLELSCNTLSDEVTQAFIKVFTADTQQIPIKHLYLDELNNDKCLDNNLNSILNSLKNNKFLKSLSLRFNTLSSDTCKSLTNIIQNENNPLIGLCLEYCIISSNDLIKLKQACLQKGENFTLNINHVLTNSADTATNISNKASFSKILSALPQPVVSKNSSLNHNILIDSQHKQIANYSTAEHTDNNENIFKYSIEQNIADQANYTVSPSLQ